jgi:serine phosphatase RsbU (regulator of sigma subunit)
MIKEKIIECNNLILKLKLNQAYTLIEELEALSLNEFDKIKIINLKGELFLYYGHYILATKSFFDSLSLSSKINNIESVSESYVGLSYAYRFLEDYAMAIEYAEKGINLGNPIIINSVYIKCHLSIGISYGKLENFDEALLNLNKALYNSEILNDDFLITTSIKSLGDLYLLKKEFSNAINAYERALVFSTNENHFILKTMILVRQAEAYENIGEIKKAISTCLIGLKESVKNQFSIGEKLAHEVLARLYERNGDIEKAFKHIKSHLFLKNSNDSLKQTQKINKMELTFVKEAKDSEISLLNKVKEQHDSISQSIDYAKGLQESILPRSDFSDSVLDYFVYFKPKEKVGGDFYYFDKIGDDFEFCVADCTGHGVPGAMLSMLCSNLVRQSFINNRGKSLQVVLQDINKDTHSILGNKSNIVTANDGMDISVCTIKKDKTKNRQWVLNFSGANHSCIIVRGEEVIQTAYNHTGISLLTPIDYGFTETSYPIEKDDCIYLFTDGYPDQFGSLSIEIRNSGGKKFKHKQLIELLKENRNKTVYDQRLNLKSTIQNWMGNLEQVDDICVLGIKFKGD